MKQIDRFTANLWLHYALCSALAVGGIVTLQSPDKVTAGWVILFISVVVGREALKLRQNERTRQMLGDKMVPRLQRKEAFISAMIAKGWNVDQQADSFVQLRRKRESPVFKSLLLFLAGCLLTWMVPVIGFIVLLIWFISLFLGGRDKVQTFSIPE